MTSFDAIVIGGGHNGLVCATLLAKSGRKVLLLEAGSELGGAARRHDEARRSVAAKLVQDFGDAGLGAEIIELARHAFSRALVHAR